jgi:DNA polymerase III delta subunit
MLYAFIGHDVKVNSARARQFVDGLVKKEPYAPLVTMTEEDFNFDALAELLQSSGLFKDKSIIKLVGVMSLVTEDVEGFVEKLAASEHIVALVDGELTPLVREVMENRATKVMQTAALAKVQPPNRFAITDALFAKDTKQLFIEIERARALNAPIEEVVGMLFWATKTMLLSQQVPTPALNPFVLRKSKRGVSVWGEAKVRALAHVLSRVIIHAREVGDEEYDALTRELLGLCT